MAMPNFNDITSLLKRGLTVEAQEKIMELREFTVKLKEENVELHQRINDLEGQVAIQEKVEWDRPYYWVKNGDKKEGPYCQLCFDKEKLLIRLQEKGNGKWFCHSCGHVFYDNNYKPPQHPRMVSSGIRGF